MLLSVGAVFAGVYVLGLFPAFREYLPTYLLESPPEEAQALFQKAASQAKERYRYLKKLESLYAPEG